MELLIVILIISILGALALSALGGATEMAREQRTRAIISKLDQLVKERYESYRTRSLPMKMPANLAANERIYVPTMRLNALRDLMRMELPDRKSDVVDGPCDWDLRPGNPNVMRLSVPALLQSYRRQVQRIHGANWATNWTVDYQGAECLYLIVATMRDGDKSALDFFSASEVGDVDEDEMKEFLDAWGQPIEFLRWAPGYAEQPGPDLKWGVAGIDDDSDGTVDNITEFGAPGCDDSPVLSLQTRNAKKAPDPFATFPNGADYALYPLIMSGGRDKSLDIFRENSTIAAPANPTDPLGTPLYHHYSPPGTDNYPWPYRPFSDGFQAGTPLDTDGDGYINTADNITNHYQETP